MPLYSDINSITPKVQPLLTDVEAIFQSIFNILETTKGEVLFFPEDGIDLEDELFELMDDTAELRILNQVTDAVEDNEPRVEIDFAQTEVIAKPDDNEFELILVFNIPAFDLQNLQIVKSFTQSAAA